ncbi:MAG: BMC domain-containing protein [Oscillospiraceae bacterium]
MHGNNRISDYNSIAKGMEVADCVLKTAEVKPVFSRAGCPGKYYLLFTGEVAAVQESIDAGCRLGGQFVVDHCVIPRVHPQVISAIHSATMLDNMRAIGVMEFFSVTASVYAADAAGQRLPTCSFWTCALNRHRRQVLCRPDRRGCSRL